jgi:carbon monoxide dehydrogenase subunit G
MKVAGEYTFSAPRQTVWDALQDPTVLTSVLPGCERLVEVGEKQYEGDLNIKVGPVQGKFQGRVEMRELEPPSRFTLSIDGRGGPGFVKATARVVLEASGEGTLMRYDSDAQVGGRIASVGQRLVDSAAKAIIRQSLDGLHGLMKARLAAGTAAGPGEPGASGVASQAEEGAEAAAGGGQPAPYEPPSQGELAARIAKEVAKDLIPKPVWIAGAIVLAILLLWFFLG